MALEDIAASVGTTTILQHECGVAAVDETGQSLTERLGAYGDELPCSPGAAATVLRTHQRGTPIAESARMATIAPITAAKTLHRLGVEGVCPLAPTAREIVRDWLHGKLTRADAVALTGGSDAEFALASYIETHDPLEGAQALTGVCRGASGDAMVEKRDHLKDAVGDGPDLG
jgi:hypothetical protein